MSTITPNANETPLTITKPNKVFDFKFYSDHKTRSPTIRSYTTRPYGMKSNQDFVDHILLNRSELAKSLYSQLLWSRAPTVSASITLVTTDSDGIQDKQILRTRSYNVPNMKEYPGFCPRVIADMVALYPLDSEAKFVSISFAFHDAKPKDKTEAIQSPESA